MPTSNGLLAPHPPTLFPPSEKQAFSGSTNSFSSSSSSSASASYFDRHSRGSLTSAYMTDITPPITPTNSNFDVELKPGTVATSGPFPDERSLQEHLAAEHLSNSLLRPIAVLEDEGGYHSDSEEDGSVFDAVANFRSRLLKSKQTANSRRALRIIESRSNPEDGVSGNIETRAEALPTEMNATSEIHRVEQQEFVLPDDWEDIFDRGMDAIWQEFKEGVYGFNPEEPQPKNLPNPNVNKSKSEVRLHDYPDFDLDSGIGHQLQKDNIPRGMVFERLPPSPKLPAKPKIRPVELDWDISSLCLDTPSIQSSSSFSMSIIPFVPAEYASDVNLSSPAMCNESSSLSLCNSPSFESSASISMSLLSPVQNDTNIIASSPAIFNESFAHGNIPLMSPPAAISRSLFAARHERRSFPVALTGENLDIAAIMRLEIAASNYPGLQHLRDHYHHEPNPVQGLFGLQTQQQYIPPSDFVSYPSFYDHSVDGTMLESLSHHQFMVIASSFAQESTPSQQQQPEYIYPHGLDLGLDFCSRPGDFLQAREVPKSPLPSDPSQPLVGLGLGSLTEGAIRSSASISRLEDETQGVAGDAKTPAMDVCNDEYSSPRVDVTANDCIAGIEPSGVLSRLQSMQSRISMSIRARRNRQDGIAGLTVDNNVHDHQASENRQSSSPVDKAYMADDESEAVPPCTLSLSHSQIYDCMAASKSTKNHQSTGPPIYPYTPTTNEAPGVGESITAIDPSSALAESQTSLERPFADSASSSRQSHSQSAEPLSSLFQASPVLMAVNLMPDSPAAAAARSSLTPTSLLIPTTVDTDAPPVPSTVVLPQTDPSDSIHIASDSITLPLSSGIATQDASSNLLWTVSYAPGHGPPPMKTVLSSPEHPSFLSRISPLHQLAQSLRTEDYVSDSRASNEISVSSPSCALQDIDISHLGMSSFALTPGNDPRSPWSPFVEYFHPESYILGCKGVLSSADRTTLDRAAQLPSSASTHVSALPPSSSGILAESRSMELESLGIGLPTGLLVASISTMSTAEECQNLAQLASAPSPDSKDFEGSSISATGDVDILSPQSAGSPTTPRLLFKVPRFAKRRLYDIPEQPTPSPTLSAYRIRTRTPTPHTKKHLHQPSKFAKWSGLTVFRRLCSSSRLSWAPLSANKKRKQPSSSAVSRVGDASDEEHIGTVLSVNEGDNSCPPRDNVSVLPVTNSATLLRRCFNKIARSTVSAPILLSPSLPSPSPPTAASSLSPGVIEHHGVPQHSFGIFKSISEGRMAPFSRKLQVLF